MAKAKSSSRNTTLKGDKFEEKIYSYFKKQIETDQFGIKRENCKIFKKRPYFSSIRQSDIIFDVVIEVFITSPDVPFFIFFIECKNYSSEPVPVSDIEEFHNKVNQVAPANSKAIVAASGHFQSGAIQYAKSTKISLFRYFSEADSKWELHRSPSSIAQSNGSEPEEEIFKALTISNYRSTIYDFYFRSPIRYTNSLWDFIEDLIRIDGFQIPASASNYSKRSEGRVPYIEKTTLEQISIKLLEKCNYSGGAVDIDAICQKAITLNKLKVVKNVPPLATNKRNPILGRITFADPTIEIFLIEPENIGRNRFTLAHEFSHFYLNHGKYLIREQCEDGDFILDDFEHLIEDIKRLEFQANYFASCLLMPRTEVLKVYSEIYSLLGITDRGYGPLYLDNQMCNISNFNSIIVRIMNVFEVSKTAAKIRLENLGLLLDARRPL